jgi:hypothetical protein
MDDRFICKHDVKGMKVRLMRNRILITAVLCLAAGCASHNKNQTSDISESDMPQAVQAAFGSEHPYAKMDHPKKCTDKDGKTVYEVPYTRPDGTSGTAKYGAMGELIVEVQKD